MSARPLVLLTDFGGTDFYAGVMRAVLASSSPASRIIDLHHDIPAHDIDAASFVLARAFEYLPHDAVVVCVVDPGVGTARRGLVMTMGERTLVGPDNGFASDLILGGAPARPSFFGIDKGRVANATGATFHGRDIFAPVAAAIARGDGAGAFGTNVDGIVMLSGVPSASVDGEVIHARARYVDHFGNVMTDIPVELVERVFGQDAKVEVAVGGRVARGLHRTYAERGRGELMAIVNSWGLVEVAVNGGRAIDCLDSPPASSIRLELRRE